MSIVTDKLKIEILKIQQGDFSSYNIFYELTSRELYNMVCSSVNSQNVEIVFAELYQEINAKISYELVEVDQFYSWVYSKLLNIINRPVGRKKSSKKVKIIFMLVSIAVVTVTMVLLVLLLKNDDEIELPNNNFSVDYSNLTEELTTREITTEEVTTEESQETTENVEQNVEKYTLDKCIQVFPNGYGYAQCIDKHDDIVGVLFDAELKVVYSDKYIVNRSCLTMFHDKIALFNSEGGFDVVDSTGKILYTSSEEVLSANVTKNNKVVYFWHSPGDMTTKEAYYFCVLDDKFNKEVEFQVSDAPLHERILYFSGCEYLYETTTIKVIDVENQVINKRSMTIYNDSDYCIGAAIYSDDHSLRFAKIDGKEDIAVDSEAKYKWYMFNHQFFGVNCDEGGANTNGFNYDFGANIKNIIISEDGKYYGCSISGEDGDTYYAVVDSDGQILYEPLKANFDFDKAILVNGYTLIKGSKGLWGIDPQGNSWNHGDRLDVPKDTMIISRARWDDLFGYDVAITDYYYVQSFIFTIDGNLVQELESKQ